jgi:DNA-binding transcriptional ArsR family regulator
MTQDAVFKALADRSRRKLLDRLFEKNGLTLSELCAGYRMSRQAVAKHLKILERANLVTTLWRGREKLHYLNPMPLQEIANRWIGKYERSRVQALADLKRDLEQTERGKHE